MTVMVALLRGINVGGKASLAMAELRSIAVDLGYDDVATYIQSGNLVLSTGRSTATVAEELAAAVASSSSVTPAVVVRTRRQLAAIVQGNPFLERGEDPAHVHVVFTDGAAEHLLANLDLAAYEPEEAVAVGPDLHLLLPDGAGRSKLVADLGRQTGPVRTQRSWKTVTKLLALADEAAG